jgi:hypothetical protein
MARREINLGTPNGNDGDLVRDAFNKANQNFLELYTISGGAIEDFTELAQDYAAQMFIDGTHVGITVTYQDDAVPPTVNLTGFSGSYNALTDKPDIPAEQVNSDWTATSGITQILNKPVLSSVAISGSYADLTNKPSIPSAQVNSDWTATSGVTQIINKPTLATVAISGQYADLTGKPDLSQYLLTVNAFTGNYDELTNTPTLFSGSYTDLTDTPTLFSGNYVDLTNKPTIPPLQAAQWNTNHTLANGNRYTAGDLVFQNGQVYQALFDNESLPVTNSEYWQLLGAGVRLQMDYLDLVNTPTIPAAQVNSDWTAASGISQILNKPVLSTVATSGQYADLTAKPTELETKLGAYNSIVLNGVSGTDNLVAGGSVIIRSGTGGTDSTLLGNIVLQNGENLLSFSSNKLVFPDATEMYGSEIRLPEDTDFEVFTSVRVSGSMVDQASMKFSKTGILTLPGNGTIVSGTGTWNLDSANKELSFPNDFRIQYGAGFQLAEQDVRLQSAGVVKVQAGAVEWVLDTNGVLTLPVAGDIRDSTGRSVIDGGLQKQVLVQDVDYSLVIGDIGKHIYLKNTDVYNLGIPTHSEVAFPLGSTITVVTGAAPANIFNSQIPSVAGPDPYGYNNLYAAGAGAAINGYIEVPARSMVTLLKVELSVWIVTGVGLIV